jgi:beta-xylosidase
LFNVPVPDSIKNFWIVPNLLTQKFPAPDFTATTKLAFTPRTDNEETGLIVTGIDYAYISLKKTSGGLVVSQTKCINAENGNPEQKSEMIPVSASTIYFRVTVKNIDPEAPDFAGFNTAENSKYGNALCNFSYSVDNINFQNVGEPFAAKKGKWIGAKVGIFAIRKGKTYETGYADFDWFRISR